MSENDVIVQGGGDGRMEEVQNEWMDTYIAVEEGEEDIERVLPMPAQNLYIPNLNKVLQMRENGAETG